MQHTYCFKTNTTFYFILKTQMCNTCKYFYHKVLKHLLSNSIYVHFLSNSIYVHVYFKCKQKLLMLSCANQFSSLFCYTWTTSRKFIMYSKHLTQRKTTKTKGKHSLCLNIGTHWQWDKKCDMRRNCSLMSNYNIL